MFLLCFFYACATSQITYSQKDLFSDTMSPGYKTGNSIDGATTYQVFFTLKSNEECIKISVLSDMKDDTARPIRTAFVVEKVIDVTPFTGSSRRKLEYSLLGRNYDTNWAIDSDIQLCSKSTDPIHTLGAGWYRIRFSAFTDLAYITAITIYSNHGVQFSQSLPPGYR